MNQASPTTLEDCLEQFTRQEHLGTAWCRLEMLCFGSVHAGIFLLLSLDVVGGVSTKPDGVIIYGSARLNSP